MKRKKWEEMTFDEKVVIKELSPPSYYPIIRPDQLQESGDHFGDRGRSNSWEYIT